MKNYIKPEIEKVILASSEAISAHSSGLTLWLEGNEINDDAGITTFEIVS